MKKNCFLAFCLLFIVACSSSVDTSATPTTSTLAVATSAPPLTLTSDPLVISPSNVADITQLVQWGKGWIQDIAWSPNGKTLA
ncbi:MAG: hypothetical protein ACREOB_09770, partial [Thermodesulfobacteriota bacterium]